MHFEILAEDVSGKIMLEHLIPKIIDTDLHTYSIKPYKGCGSIPKGLKTSQDPAKRSLLNQLPRLLNAYGNTFKNYQGINAVVIVVCDLDKRDREQFLGELHQVLESCSCAPRASFCLAIEECEAWLLGDWNAVKNAYPNARRNVFGRYRNDSICNTWEMLADVVYPGGYKKLVENDYVFIGQIKCEWAERIAPLMDVRSNKSPSFNDFKAVLEEYASKDSCGKQESR